MNENYLQVIASSPVFKGFTSHGVQMVFDLGTVKHYEPGQMLLSAGEPSSFATLVLAGKVCVFVERQGREFVLRELGPGAIVGELGVLCGIARTASIRAVEQVAALEWTSDKFRSLLLRDASLSERIFSHLLRTLVEKERAYIDSVTRQESATE